MDAITKRMKSKTYWANVLYGLTTYALANAGVLSITAPGAVLGLVVVNLLVRELTSEPISAK